MYFKWKNIATTDDRRHETSTPENKDFINHVIANGIFLMFSLASLLQSP